MPWDIEQVLVETSYKTAAVRPLYLPSLKPFEQDIWNTAEVVRMNFSVTFSGELLHTDQQVLDNQI